MHWIGRFDAAPQRRNGRLSPPDPSGQARKPPWRRHADRDRPAPSSLPREPRPNRARSTPAREKISRRTSGFLSSKAPTSACTPTWPAAQCGPTARSARHRASGRLSASIRAGVAASPIRGQGQERLIDDRRLTFGEHLGQHGNHRLIVGLELNQFAERGDLHARSFVFDRGNQ